MLPTALTEELKLLKRALREEAFRVVIIEHQNYTLVRETQTHLQAAFPQRNVRILQSKDKDYRAMMDDIYAQASGILLIADTEEMLQNESLSSGFNQRRDKLATFPLAIILFVAVGKLPLLAKRMPDIFSRISLTFNWEGFRADAKSTIDFNNQKIQYESTLYSSIGKDIVEKRQIFTQLQAEIASTPPSKLDLLDVLYRRYIQLAKELAEYQAGLEAVKAYLDLINKQTILPDKTETLAYLHDRWGAFAQDLGDYEIAEVEIKKALQQAVQAENENFIGTYQNNLAIVYLYLRQYEKARDLLEKSLVLITKSFGEKHPETANIQTNLAVIYRNLGQYEKAKDLLEQALASNLKIFGKEHPNVAISQSNLAMVYQNLGQSEMAKVLLENSLKSNIKNFSTNHPNVAICQNNLALIHLDLQNYNKAKELFESAYQIWVNNLGENHPHTKQLIEGLDYVNELIAQQEEGK